MHAGHVVEAEAERFVAAAPLAGHGATIVDNALVQYVAIGVGAVLGANLRHVLTLWLAERLGTTFPFGTFAINVSGSFAIGVVLGLIALRTDIDPLWRLFLASGVLGGYTTFSSYAWDALTLMQQGALLKGLLYVGGSNVLALAGVWVGSLIASRGG